MGYACFGPHPLTHGTYDLYWIAVDPGAQGRGIGRALLAHVEHEVRARGGRLLLIETSDTPAYASARRLYERTGYQREAIIHDFYAPGDSLLIFAKNLVPFCMIEPSEGYQPLLQPVLAEASCLDPVPIAV